MLSELARKVAEPFHTDARLTTRELFEKGVWPNGIVYFWSNVLVSDAARNGTEQFRMPNLFTLSTPWLEEISKDNDAYLAEGTNADIVSELIDNFGDRAALRGALLDKYVNSTKLVFDKYPPNHSFITIVNRMLRGSDTDFRKLIPQEEIIPWSQRLVDKATEMYQVPKREISTTKENEITRVHLPCKGKLNNSWATDATLSGFRGAFTHMVPQLLFDYGEYPDSGIKFCHFHIGGTRFIDTARKNIRIYSSSSLSSSPEAMSPGKVNADTRLSPGLLNSWDRVPGARLLSNFPDQFLSNGVPASLPRDYWRPTAEQAYIFTDGIHGPSLPGRWVGDPPQYQVIQIPRPEFSVDLLHKNAVRMIDPLLHVSNETIDTLNRPIKFGPSLGSTDHSAQTTFSEVVRTIRKASIHNRWGLDQNDPKTAEVQELMNGNIHFKKKKLIDHLKQLKPEEKNSLNLDASTELGVSLFYSPRETVELGKKFGFEQYYSNWKKYLAPIAYQLPSRKELDEYNLSVRVRELRNTSYKRIVDGIELIVFLVRKNFPDDKELWSRPDNLELFLWLTQFNPG